MADKLSDFEYDFFVSRRGAVGEIAAEVARVLEESMQTCGGLVPLR